MSSKKEIVIPKGYKPTLKEEFMNPIQKEYFRIKLIEWKDELIKESEETLASVVEETEDTYNIAGDDVDRANDEANKQVELRIRDRYNKLIAKIDQALKRVEDGSYGYCVETREPISLKRLEAKPTATLSIEAQEDHEEQERQRRKG